MHAVVPAAGRGTRLSPLTDDRPKPLVEIAGRPLLAHVLDALAAVDPDRYVVVVGDRGERIREAFGDRYRKTPIKYVRQPEPLGLADAVRRGGEAVYDELGGDESGTDEPGRAGTCGDERRHDEPERDEPAPGGEFVVLNGDNVLRDDLSRLAGSDAAVTMLVERVTREAARETGVVVTDGSGRVERVVEKPSDPPSTLVSAGAYRFTPAITDACRRIGPADTGEYELADAITDLIARGERVEAVELEGERVNVNTPADLDRAAAILEP